MKKSDENNNNTDHDEPSSSASTDPSGLPVNESASFLFDVFEKSIEKLEPVDRQLVVEQQTKLMNGFRLLNEKISEILSTEEGKKLFDQEMRKRRGT